MAYIGLRKPIMAARKGYEDYETPSLEKPLD